MRGNVKVTCILTSFNRPTWVRQALGSVAAQTHLNYELIVVDESDAFDVHEAVSEFAFPSVKVIHFDIRPEERKGVNRLSRNVNEGLKAASGDLICYLADDDFYFPGWFAAASGYFERNPGMSAAFGKLIYTRSRGPEYPTSGQRRFFEGPVADPFCRLDHNQIVHRRFKPPIPWPEDAAMIGGPDAYFMKKVAERHLFHPIFAWAAVKRLHGKNLQQAVDVYRAGKMGGIRE